MNRLAYRNLVGVCYSEAEAKKIAEDKTFTDGPNDQGEFFDRPGKLTDHFPAPYKNEEHARSINNGALPPDLSLIGKSRGRGEDYIFALLTGYPAEPPAGVVLAAGQYYNPYFAGGKIGMPKQLIDGAVDYPDGTPATESQMAKDVAVFLAWAAEPDQGAFSCLRSRAATPLHPSSYTLTSHSRLPTHPNEQTFARSMASSGSWPLWPRRPCRATTSASAGTPSRRAKSPTLGNREMFNSANPFFSW